MNSKRPKSVTSKHRTFCRWKINTDRAVDPNRQLPPVTTNTPMPPVKPLKPSRLSREQLELCMQWFESIQDTNGQSLNIKDYSLAKLIYEQLGLRVPNTIINTIKELSMKYGEIETFDAGARCPYCDEVTDVNQSEMRSQEAQCQHCDEVFAVSLDA